MACVVIPPGVTYTFFSGMPPNATISSVFATIVGQDDAPRSTRPALPTRCGSSTSEVPRL